MIVAVSFLPPQVSGGGDRVIHVWSADTCTHLHTFKGHREAVTVREEMRRRV